MIYDVSYSANLIKKCESRVIICNFFIAEMAFSHKAFFVEDLCAVGDGNK